MRVCVCVCVCVRVCVLSDARLHLCVSLCPSVCVSEINKVSIKTQRGHTQVCVLLEKDEKLYTYMVAPSANSFSYMSRDE